MLLKENIPFSYVFGKIKKELIILTVYSAAVYIAHTYLNFPGVSIPLAIPSILGTIISLLLAFRSNQAYDRWWEARTLWGAIVNDARSFSRQVLSFVNDQYSDEEKRDLKERMIKRQIAWCYSVSSHLRGQDAHKNLSNFVSEKEIKALANRKHVPVALLEQHGNDLRLLLQLGWINQYQQVAMDETLTRFSNALGGCERIKSTVFPSTYSVYIHYLVLLFVLLLPFGLIEFFGVFQIPMVLAISASFFLIEKMAINLQDPFENKPTDTPTTTICRKIEGDLRQMLQDSFPEENKTITTSHQKEGMFYIL